MKLTTCQMTVDPFECGRDDFIPEVEDRVGSARFRPRTLEAGVNLLCGVVAEGFALRPSHQPPPNNQLAR